MYQALYRKWRPRTFDDVVGQDHVTETLKNQIISGRLSHAYLFVGTRGTGKTSCAKILSRAVNCEHPENGNPCNKCRSCLGIEDGSIMDVVELDAASNNGVDNVRALRDEAVFSPVTVKKRVYIIDEVHMLSTSAFNALLKILEEPPEHLMFILATTELHKVPATILSRCQRHSFKRIDPDSLADRLYYVAKQENMKLEPDAAALLARLSEGSLRDGLSLLDQCSGNEMITSESVLSAMGLVGNLRISQLLKTIVDGETGAAITLFGDMWRDGKAPATLLLELSALLRDILMIKVAPKGGRELLSGSFDLSTLKTFSGKMTSEELICDIDSIQAHIGALRDGRDPKTSAELCLIELCEPELGDSIDTLKKRIAKLEMMIKRGTIQQTQQHQNSLHNMEEPDRFYEADILLNVNGRTDERQIISEKDNTEPNISDNKEYLPIEKEDPSFELNERSNENDNSADEIHETDKKHGEIISEVHKDFECSGDIWKDILAELKKNILPGHFSVISNDRMAKGVFEGETLTINVANTFTKGQLEQATVMDQVRQAVQIVIGRAVQIKIDVNSANQTASAEKLNDLSKYGNVKFE